MDDVPGWRTAANWVLALYATALWLSTHLPFSHEVVLPGANDKTLHFLAYGGFGVLAGLRLAVWGQTRGSLWVFWTVGLCAAAALDELTQNWVGRSGNWGDWAADVVGLLLGMSLSRLGWWGWCRICSYAAPLGNVRDV